MNELLNVLYNKLLKSCIMHKLVPCKIYKRDEKIGICNENDN